MTSLANMNRRSFLGISTLAAGASIACRSSAPPVAAGPANKRERMLQWLAGKADPNYTPAAFFLHFGDPYKSGSAAAKRHLEYFRQTDMDFVKIQFEQAYDPQPFLKKPADWAKLPLRKIDFYEPLVQTARELVRDAKKDALVLMTLYSPYMGAGQCAPEPLRKQHMEENPEAVKKGLEILTESQLIFVRACIAAGVDGFYMSTQGGEATTFSNPKIFTEYVKPFDLVSMKEIQAACPFNILHVCDYNAPYANYDAHLDYPGHVINCNTRLAAGEISMQEIAGKFKRPYMGGMDRHGILAKGTPEQVAAEVTRVIKSAPRPFILGADCTVEADTPWDRLHQAIAVAHGARA
jgi:uroporphyrinogen decarboxylase